MMRKMNSKNPKETPGSQGNFCPNWSRARNVFEHGRKERFVEEEGLAQVTAEMFGSQNPVVSEFLTFIEGKIFST